MVNCCVAHCKTYKKKRGQERNEDKVVSYHEFPSDLSLRFLWLKVIGRKDFVVNDKSRSSVVCSKHFKKEDFIFSTKRRRLKKDAIPSIFPYHTVQIKRTLPPLTHSEPTRIKKELLDEGEAMAVEEDLSGVSLNSYTVEPSPMELNSSIQKEVLAVKEELSGVPIYSSTVEPSPIKTSSIPEKKLTPREIVSTEKDLNGAPMNSSSVKPSQIKTSSIPEKQLTVKEIVSYVKDLVNNNDPIKSPPKTSLPVVKTYHSLERKLAKKEKLLALLTDKLKAKTLEVTRMKRKVYKLSQQLRKVSSKSIPMKEKLQAYSNNTHYQNLEKLLKLQEEGLCTVSQDFILTQFKYMFSKQFHWPEKTLRECILLHTVSPEGYRAIMERNLVTLPSRGTLSRYTGPIVDESRPSTLKIRTQAVNSQPVGDLGH